MMTFFLKFPLMSALGVSLLAHLALFCLWDTSPPVPSGTALAVTLRAPAEMPENGGTSEADSSAAPLPLPELHREAHFVPTQKPEASVRHEVRQARPDRSISAQNPVVIVRQPEPTPAKMVVPQERPTQTAPPMEPPSMLAAITKPDGPHAEASGETASTNGGSANPNPVTAGAASSGAAENHEQVTEDAVREYRYALARNVQGVSRRYPAWPDAAGRTGTARIKLTWRHGIAQVSLPQSSGMPRLDETAQAIMREAVAHTPLPPALQHRAFDTVLPVEYRRN